MRENKLKWKLSIICAFQLITLILFRCFMNSNRVDSCLKDVEKNEFLDPALTIVYIFNPN